MIYQKTLTSVQMESFDKDRMVEVSGDFQLMGGLENKAMLIDNIEKASRWAHSRHPDDIAIAEMLRKYDFDGVDRVLSVNAGSKITHLIYGAMSYVNFDVVQYPAFPGKQGYYEAMQHAGIEVRGLMNRFLHTRLYSPFQQQMEKQRSIYDGIVLLNLDSLPGDQVRRIGQDALRLVKSGKFIFLASDHEDVNRYLFEFMKHVAEAGYTFDKVEEQDGVIMLRITKPREVALGLAWSLRRNNVPVEKFELYLENYRKGIFPPQEMKLYGEIHKLLAYYQLDPEDRKDEHIFYLAIREMEKPAPHFFFLFQAPLANQAMRSTKSGNSGAAENRMFNGLGLSAPSRDFLGHLEGLNIEGKNGKRYQLKFDKEDSYFTGSKFWKSEPAEIFNILEVGQGKARQVGLIDIAPLDLKEGFYSKNGKFILIVRQVHIFNQSDRRQGIFDGFLKSLPEGDVKFEEIINKDTLFQMAKGCLEQDHIDDLYPSPMDKINLASQRDAIKHRYGAIDMEYSKSLIYFLADYALRLRRSAVKNKFKDLTQLFLPTPLHGAISTAGLTLTRVVVEKIKEEDDNTRLAISYWAHKPDSSRNLGGIDLNPSRMDLNVKGDPRDFEFQVNGRSISGSKISGATFNIRTITPVVDIASVLGV